MSAALELAAPALGIEPAFHSCTPRARSTALGRGRLQALTQPIRQARHRPLTHFEAGQVLLLQGDISKAAYYVEQGCLRLNYNDEGRDITLKFFFPGSIVSSMESYVYGTPSQFGIETVIPTITRKVSKDHYDRLVNTDPGFGDIIQRIAIDRMRAYQDLFLKQIKNTPEERYTELLQEMPEIFDLVPHHYIASYLGVTRVSLSRIRRRLK